MQVQVIEPRARRLPGRLSVYWASVGGPVEHGLTVDLSADGFSFVTRRAVPPGTLLAVRVMLPSGEGAYVRAAVVWSRDASFVGTRQHAMGVRITDAEPAWTALVLPFVAAAGGAEDAFDDSSGDLPEAAGATAEPVAAAP